MTTTAQSIIKDAQVNTLLDATGTRWSATSLVECLNWAQRAIAAVRWDATASSSTLTLLAGAAQVLPTTAQGLIELTNNASGTKGAIRQCRREDLDAIEPTWRNGTQSGTVQHFIYDPRYPRRFDVYPPAVVGTQIEGVVSAYPLDVAAPTAPGLVYTTVTGNIGLPDEFAPALVHLVAYRAYLKDADYAANAALAKAHLDSAVSMVGDNLRAAVEISPASEKDQGK